MELKKKYINIRITDTQLKRLKLAIAKERKTMSEIIRRILQQYIQDNPQSVITKSTEKKVS
jgi:metal-responsive CopG/Arc/MetJ family transcriptional regulator